MKKLTDKQKSRLWELQRNRNFQASRRLEGVEMPLVTLTAAEALARLEELRVTMSDKFGEGRDPYLYPGLDIMRNRLNIRQQQRLEQAAYEMTALRAATIELGPLVRGLPHLRTIHRQLYQDIFDWAGQLREVDIYQGDTPFCHFAYIEKEGNALMQDLEEEGYLVGLEKAKFVERLAHYYCEINVLHPFRVGSGLAQRIFFEQLAIHAGYQLSWQGIEKEAWNQANQSGAMGDLTALQMIFSKVVSEAGESE